ncbi:PREDICTED: beta-glucosidase, partial [Prunus dulcis]
QLSLNGVQGALDWLNIYPKGIEELLIYTRNNYCNSLIYITENGVDEFNNPKVSLAEVPNDTTKMDYYKHHIYYIQSAI